MIIRLLILLLPILAISCSTENIKPVIKVEAQLSIPASTVFWLDELANDIQPTDDDEVIIERINQARLVLRQVVALSPSSKSRDVFVMQLKYLDVLLESESLIKGKIRQADFRRDIARKILEATAN